MSNSVKFVMVDGEKVFKYTYKQGVKCINEKYVKELENKFFFLYNKYGVLLKDSKEE